LIHENGQPFTAPLGIRFADLVDVVPIARETAASVYDAHHTYIDSLPSVNLAHHGIYVQGALIAGDTIVEAARICLGLRIPNLASAALARAQARFVRDHADRDVRFLLT